VAPQVMTFRLFLPTWRTHAGTLGVGLAAFSGGAALIQGGDTSPSLPPASLLPISVARAEAVDGHQVRARERLVVLGSGWGAVGLIKHIDPKLYDLVVVSPRNYFLNTPLLPGITVGTVEARSLNPKP